MIKLMEYSLKLIKILVIFTSRIFVQIDDILTS